MKKTGLSVILDCQGNTGLLKIVNSQNHGTVRNASLGSIKLKRACPHAPAPERRAYPPTSEADLPCTRQTPLRSTGYGTKSY